MVIISTSKMPTNCAPTVSYDSKNPGWSNCEASCNHCTKCKPDPDTDCGQMLIASGVKHCVPPGCAMQCCKSEYKPAPVIKKDVDIGTGVGTGSGSGDLPSDQHPVDPNLNTSKKDNVATSTQTHSNVPIIIGVLVGVSLTGALIFVMVKKFAFSSNKKSVL
jgi:hypothetical protein